MIFLYVMVAGGIGSVLRYAVSIAFPHGTVIVNLIGCFLLGAVVQFAVAGSWTPELRAAMAAGFLGGLTTYSSFNQETLAMLASGAIVSATANIAITLIGGLAAGSLGLAAARALTG